LHRTVQQELSAEVGAGGRGGSSPRISSVHVASNLGNGGRFILNGKMLEDPQTEMTHTKGQFKFGAGTFANFLHTHTFLFGPTMGHEY